MSRERRDALRHRLYARGADAVDVDRYRRAVRRRRLPLAGAALLGAGLAAAAAAVGSAEQASVDRPTAAHAAAARTASADPPWVVVVAADGRQRFVASLEAGRAAGLADFFLADPAALPGQLRTTTRADSQECRGTGRRTLALQPTDLADHGGRLTVVVVTDRDTELRLDATVPRSAHTLRLTAGLPEATTTRYAGAAPTVLGIETDPDVRWGALVTFTD